MAELRMGHRGSAQGQKSPHNRLKQSNSEQTAHVPKGYRGRRKQPSLNLAPHRLLEVELTPEVAQAKRDAIRLQNFVLSKKSRTVSVDRHILVQILSVLEQAKENKLPRAAQDATAVLDEISPQQAARILRMSRPSVMRLVEQGHLRARKVHSHHRLSAAEVAEYARQHARKRTEALDELSALSQELNI